MNYYKAHPFETITQVKNLNFARHSGNPSISRILITALPTPKNSCPGFYSNNVLMFLYGFIIYLCIYPRCQV